MKVLCEQVPVLVEIEGRRRRSFPLDGSGYSVIEEDDKPEGQQYSGNFLDFGKGRHHPLLLDHPWRVWESYISSRVVAVSRVDHYSVHAISILRHI